MNELGHRAWVTGIMNRLQSTMASGCRHCTRVNFALLLVFVLTVLGCQTGFRASHGGMALNGAPHTAVPRTLTEQRMNRRETIAQDIEAKTRWARALYYNSPGDRLTKETAVETTASE